MSMPRFYLGGALQRGESITWTGSIADVTIFLEAFPTNQSARGRSLVKLAYTWDIPSTCFNAGAYPGADWNSEDNCLLSASRSLTGVAAPPRILPIQCKMMYILYTQFEIEIGWLIPQPVISCMTPFAIKTADSQIRLLGQELTARTQLDTWHTKGPLAALRGHEFRHQ